MSRNFRKYTFLPIIFIIFLSSCGNFSLYDELGLERLNSTLSLTPASATVGINTSITFAATGGTPPYVYSLTSGSGSIDKDSGVYNAPAAPGTDLIAVTDFNDVLRNISVLIVDPTFNPLSLVPAAVTLSTNNVFFFVSIGGIPPYTYSVIAGGGSIDAGTGKFNAPGTTGVSTIQVKDASSATDTSAVTVLEGLVIIPQTVSVPANNNVAFSASGGTAPYTYTMESGAGSITAAGFYTAPGGIGIEDKVKVADNAGNSRIATISITSPQPLNINPSSFIILISDNFTFSASGGSSPYTYSKISGNGSITADGDYSAPGIPGVDVIRVTDSLGLLTADAFVTIVNIGPLTIAPVDITVEQDTSYTFSASGGTPQYTYSVIAGTGVVNSSTGEYTAPTALGMETIRVTDAALNTSDATVHVAPAAPTNLVVDGTFPGPQDIQLTWTDNATGEDGYSIEQKLSGGVFVEIGTVGSNVTSYIDGLLAPNPPYSYRIRAYQLPGPVYSGYSNDDFDIPNS